MSGEREPRRASEVGVHEEGAAGHAGVRGSAGPGRHLSEPFVWWKSAGAPCFSRVTSRGGAAQATGINRSLSSSSLFLPTRFLTSAVGVCPTPTSSPTLRTPTRCPAIRFGSDADFPEFLATPRRRAQSRSRHQSRAQILTRISGHRAFQPPPPPVHKTQRNTLLMFTSLC